MVRPLHRRQLDRRSRGLQTSPTLGIVLSLAVIVWTRTALGTDAFTPAYLSSHSLGSALVDPIVVTAVAFVLGVMLMPVTRKISIGSEEEAFSRPWTAGRAAGAASARRRARRGVT